MSGVYFVTLNNKIFTTRVRSRTCIVGFTTRVQARRAMTALNKSRHVDYGDEAQVDEVNILEPSFYNMLKQNQFMLMVSDRIEMSDMGDSFAVYGDAIDPPTMSRNEEVVYLEKLVRK